jgi:hypothetical protein
VSVSAHDDGGTGDGGTDTSTPQTLTITVTAVQDAPVAVDDAATTDEETPVTFDVLANDTDADGDGRSLAGFDASTVTDGALTSNGGGSFTYVPNAGFVGTETFTYTVADGQGGTDGGAVTLTVNDVEHAPDAVGDAYTIAPATTLTVTAPGLLHNDSDHDADSLGVDVVPVADPANGVLTLSADGAFDYTPNIGFSGTDTFQYRIDDGTGRTDIATVTVVVSATASASRLYLRSSGSSTDTWDMTAVAPPNSGSVPDWDGDGDPGLFVKSSGGGENESDPLKWQDWLAPAPAAVNGPVTLHLEASARDFALKKDLHPHVYLYDCNNALTNCTLILAADVHISGWSGLLATWVDRDVPLGPLSHTFLPGRVLRMKLLVGHSDVWVALTGERPSWLELTLP